MKNNAWIKEFCGSIIVCDQSGIIVEMNDRAVASYNDEGGSALIGKNLLDCHSPRSQEILRDLLKTQKKNVYTIEKHGVKKIIYQSPWYENGEFRGLVELSLEIPQGAPHFKRD